MCRVLLFLSTVLLISGCSGATKKICHNIEMREGKLDLSANEKVLVCGSDKGKEGWKDVPIPQAQYQLKVILQNNGYLNPRFERQGDSLLVWSGPLERIEHFDLHGAEGVLHKERKRLVVGEALTPEKLDEVKNWAEVGLKEAGFACPQVDVIAQAWDHRVVATVNEGQRARVVNLDYSGLDNIDPRALARYQAIEPGDWHDARKIQLTASRMLADGLFQTAYFKTRCRGGEVDLTLVTTVGKPRILRFGVGASTEEFPFARLWFKNARLDDRASSLTSTLYASPRVQSADVSAEFYRIPWSRRSYLGPRFLVARESERTYEVIRGKLGCDIGRLFDVGPVRMIGKLGPTLNYVHTAVGIGPKDLRYLSWEGSLLAMSNRYELFQRDQFEGWQAQLEYRGQRKGLGAEINVDRYEVNAKYLWNINSYAPPLFILATRLQAIGLNTKQIWELGENYAANAAAAGNTRGLLPVDYRVFFGGDQNLRGFTRQGLDNGGLGYATALYMGWEFRWIRELPYRLEPFFLFDSAQLGERQMTLDAPWFTSTGVGLRWPSPFGTLRGSAAKGKITNGDEYTDRYPQEWVYFLSFGQEF